MTLIIDSAPLIALADRKDPRQQQVETLFRSESGELVIPGPVTAEVDYLLGRRLDRNARLAFLDDLATGRFIVACLTRLDHQTIADLDRHYNQLDAGLTDLSIVVMAERFNTRRIATFDQRDFLTLRPLNGGIFKLLPSL